MTRSQVRWVLGTAAMQAATIAAAAPSTASETIGQVPTLPPDFRR